MSYKRADIKTGFLCNNNCRFCVQADNRRFGNRSTEDIKKDLRDAKKSGCSGVVFTGGEVTIRQDLIGLVRYAKTLGFRDIQLQSNARMLSYKKLCEKVIRAGANEFGPALHGHNAELHDHLTRAKGSFKQTVQAIKNLRELNQYIIANTVVVRPNYKFLPDIADLLIKLGVDQFQFAFMHAMGNAYMNIDELMPRVSEAAPFIKKGLQKGIDNGIKVMAEAMPLCTMKDYEMFCSEFYIPQTEVRNIDFYDPSFDDTRKNEGKMKFPQCKRCIYDRICEGPWREYPEKEGDGEFKPVTGKNRESSGALQIILDRAGGSANKLSNDEIDEEENILGTLQITRRCNQNCVFCSAPREQYDLSMKEVYERMILFRETGVNEVMFTGGEPTLRDDLPKMISLAHRFGFREVSMQTNGSQLYKKRLLESYIRAGGIKLSISFHSSREEIFKKLAGGRSSLKRFVEGVHNVGTMKISAYFVVVINSLNYKHLREHIEFCHRHFPFMKHFSMNFVDPTNNAFKNKWIVPKLSEAKPYMLDAFKYIIDNEMSFRIEFVPLCFLGDFTDYSSELRRETDKAPSFATKISGSQEGGRDHDYMFKRENKYFEAPACKGCRLHEKCSWINNNYVKIHGYDELPGDSASVASQ